MNWEAWIVIVVLTLFVVGVGASFFEAIREQVILNKNAKKRKLQEGAAEYDRLRDEEFRELGWTGKY